MLTMSTMPPCTRLEGEPTAWYGRFLLYLSLGPNRSVASVWRNEAPGGSQRRILPGNWRRAARRYRWQERAEGYNLALAQDWLTKFANLEKAMRLRDLNQIEEIRDELAKLVVSYRESPPSPSRLLQLIRATSLLHRMTERALTGLLQFQDITEKRGFGPVGATIALPTCISQPREKRGTATNGSGPGKSQKKTWMGEKEN